MSSRPFCVPASPATPPDFAGRILVLPVVSVGCVPQLAVDLLVHAPELQCTRVASLDHAECVPFVAPVEAGTPDGGVYTALDVYEAHQGGLVLVQQRSPVLKRLMDWVREARFAEVLLLGTVDAAFRTDAEMHTPRLQLRPLEAEVTQAARVVDLPVFGTTPLPPVPGGGLMRTYLAHAPPCTLAVLQFCAEGDNRGDAYALAADAVRVCRVSVTAWREPESWASLYGAAPEQQLYG